MEAVFHESCIHMLRLKNKKTNRRSLSMDAQMICLDLEAHPLTATSAACMKKITDTMARRMYYQSR